VRQQQRGRVVECGDALYVLLAGERGDDGQPVGEVGEPHPQRGELEGGQFRDGQVVHGVAVAAEPAQRVVGELPHVSVLLQWCARWSGVDGGAGHGELL
jgi:hypothetical protein